MRYILPAGSLVQVRRHDSGQLTYRCHRTRRELTFDRYERKSTSSMTFREGGWLLTVITAGVPIGESEACMIADGWVLFAAWRGRKRRLRFQLHASTN